MDLVKVFELPRLPFDCPAMFRPLLSLTISLGLASIVRSAPPWNAQPFSPPSYPLAVRSPYLSAWLPQGSGLALNEVWPEFWGGGVVGWAGFVRVDTTTYSFLGLPAVPGATFAKAVQKSAKFTATQSVFVLQAGPVDLTVTFLSPVEPKDLLKQSLPFSYLSVVAASRDGASHNVAVYTDISAEWVSGDNALRANWTTTTDSGILTHQTRLVNPTVYGEVRDRIQHGSSYYSTAKTANTTFQTGADTVVRANFVSSGALPNTEDKESRAINDRWPVFAFAQKLGAVTSTPSAPVVFTVGHVRDPIIQYIVKGNTLQDRLPYFLTRYATAAQIIADFLPDYTKALGRANAMDAQVRTDALKISEDYAAIVDLSVRQTFGSIELSVSRSSNGAINATDILVFMKEISSNGNMNTVDVIFPAWPAFLYFNPELGRYLLEVLFRYQESGLYPNKWAIHDIGASYPKALGHNDGGDEPMPVEESGNMLIMALSYTRKTGNRYIIDTYGRLLDQWNQFLIEDSLIPNNQLSTDDFAGPLANQTNLAIKGIIGIKAMAEVAGLLGNAGEAANYSSIAASYVTQWETLSASKTQPHRTLGYNSDSSWGLTYNLYSDKLLKFNLFPQRIYDQQTAWYATVAREFGVPLDTRHEWTKTDWEIWTAAIASTKEVRDLFISSVRKYAANGLNRQPFGDWYETPSGRVNGFRARPVVGGHLALLDL